MLLAVEATSLDPEDIERIREALHRFDELKSSRNAMAHCRIIDASIRVGLSDGLKGKRCEILLTEEALDLLYWHLVWSERELSSAGSVIMAVGRLNSLADDHPLKLSAQQHVTVHRINFYSNSDTRRRLRPLPDFPTEAEMEVAVSARRRSEQAKLSEWMSQDLQDSTCRNPGCSAGRVIGPQLAVRCSLYIDDPKKPAEKAGFPCSSFS
jgi:hypothetical protein